MKKEFDNIIKQKLNDIELNQASDWDSFSKIIDEEILSEEDAKFDKEISSKLNNNYITFNSLHWVLLKKRLEDEEKSLTRIYSAKLIELCVLLLVIFAGNSFGWFAQEDKEDYYFAAQERFESALQNYKQDLSERTKVLKETKIIAQTANQSSNTIKYNQQSSTVQNLISNATLTITDVNQLRYANEIEFKTSNISSLSAIDISIPAVASINVNALEINDDELIDLAYVNPIKTSKTSKPSRFGIYGSLNNIQINTPFDKVYNLKSYSNSIADKEFGFTLGKSIAKNVEIETGMGYNSVAYTPDEVDELNGSFEDTQYKTNISKVSFNIVSVPLFLKYYFANYKDLSFYAIGGLKTNYILSTDYEVDKTLTNRDRNNPASFSEGIAEFKLLEKEFNVGLIDGGNILDNFFITADIGVGIEQNFGDVFSLNFQTKYARYMSTNGIGPNVDKLHNGSFSLGLKYTL